MNFPRQSSNVQLLRSFDKRRPRRALESTPLGMGIEISKKGSNVLDLQYHTTSS